MFRAFVRWQALEASSAAVRGVAVAFLVALYAALVTARVIPPHDIVVTSIVLFGAFRLCTSLPESKRFLATFGLAFAILLVNVVWLWRVGWVGRNHVFGGVIALSDAHGYYEDAERVLYGLPMNDGGVRRPLSVAVMGGMLRLLGGHVRWMMLVIAAFWAAAVAMVRGEVSRTHGTVAGAVVSIALLLFARRYAGLFQPEGIAAPIGAIAFCLLWRSASESGTASLEDDRWVRAFAGGLLLLTIALLARPGPLTAPFAVLAWGVFVARRRARSQTGRVLAIGVIAVALGWGVQSFVQRATSPNASFNDYPAIFYGMLHNEDHTFLARSQAWLQDLPEANRASATIALVRRQLGEHPLLLPVGLVRCFFAHLALPQGLFGIVWMNPDDRVLEEKAVVDRAMHDHGILGPVIHWVHELGVYSLLNAVGMALLAVAFVVAFVWSMIRAKKKRPHDPHVELLLFWTVGIAISWPLLPPWITEGAQMHASVFVAIVALPSIFFLGREAPNGVANGPTMTSALAIAGGIVAIVSIVLVAPAPLPAERSCEADVYRVTVDRRARITFGERPEPTIQLADALKNIALLKKRNRDISAALERAATSSSEIIPGFDACRGKLYYFIDATDHFRTAPEWAPFTGTLLAPENPVVVAPSP